MIPSTAAGSAVIVGAGQAGVQVADSLRAGGFDGPVVLLGDEPGLPYQRPPLSKDFLAGGDATSPLPLRGRGFFADRKIDFRPGVTAVHIDRTQQTVRLCSGQQVRYASLVLATGAGPRRLPVEGSELAGVLELRTLAHARSLRHALGLARSTVVAGAGFIGLEFAAAARTRGVEVTVLESADQVLRRAVSRTTARHLVDTHRSGGTDVRLGEGVATLEGAAGTVRAVVSSTGRRHPADLVVLGVGVLARDDLARDAGLDVDDGVVVDRSLRTSDPAIFAIGDCARFPSGPDGLLHRLESVQNATDQARHVARQILRDAPAPYSELPWFWSKQGPITLQIAGLAAPEDDSVVLGDPTDGRFSVLRYRAGRLVAVESVNRPADHVAARRVLPGDDLPTPAQVAHPSFDLKEHASRATARGRLP